MRCGTLKCERVPLVVDVQPCCAQCAAWLQALQALLLPLLHLCCTSGCTVTAEAYVTPEAAVLTQLYTKLLNDYLSEVRHCRGRLLVRQYCRPGAQRLLARSVAGRSAL